MAAIAAAVLAYLSFFQGDSIAERLRILHTNDMHAHFLPHATSAGDTLGGLARLATLVQQARGENPTCLLLDAGDAFQGTPFYNFFKGGAEFRVMSAIGYDAMTVGNHELDDGPVNLLRQAARHATFPIISSNLLVPGWLKRRAEKPPATPGAGFDPAALAESLAAAGDTALVSMGLPWAVLRTGDLNVGVIGVTTETLPAIVAAKNRRDLHVLPVARTVRSLVPRLRGQCDLIVVLSHCGLAADSVLARFVPGIDVIVSSHDHQALASPSLVINPDNSNGIGGTLLVETGQWAENLGLLDLEVEDRRIHSYSGRLLPVTSAIPEAPAVQALVKEYQARIEPMVSRVVAVSTASFPSDSVLVAETPLGDLIADIMREAVGADLAIQNGGGIRGPLPMGAISVGDVYSVLPFENTIVTVTLTGRQIQGLCREMASRRGGGGFGQVSGMSMEVIAGRPTRIRIGGKPLAPLGRYKVATNNFTAAGGDGYTTFRKGADYTDTGILLRDAVLQALTKARVVKPPSGGRVRFLN